MALGVGFRLQPLHALGSVKVLKKRFSFAIDHNKLHVPPHVDRKEEAELVIKIYQIRELKFHRLGRQNNKVSPRFSLMCFRPIVRKSLSSLVISANGLLLRWIDDKQARTKVLPLLLCHPVRSLRMSCLTCIKVWYHLISHGLSA